MAQRGSERFPPDMADAAIAAASGVLPAARCALAAGAGRILRQTVYPERDNPPFDRVCMDGIAIADTAFVQGLRRFAIEASQQAGAPAVALRDARNAVEVMTGAVVPAGTNCVIPLEEFDLDSDVAILKDAARAAPLRNIQRRGEDGSLETPMLLPGVRLGAPELAIVASAGLAEIDVGVEPRFMVISTGDELIEPGRPIADHQVRRSNVFAVMAALRGRGFGCVADDHLADDEGVLARRLRQHLEANDVLILSGGVSKGKFDFVPKVLKAIGVREVFAHVTQRPGAPMWFGVGPNGQLVFGLPGNPVATLVCLLRFVIPAAQRLMGAAPPALEYTTLLASIDRGRPMAYYVPVTLTRDAAGRPGALPKLTNGPGDFLGLSGSDGFVELPPRPEGFAVGTVAPLYRW